MNKKYIDQKTTKLEISKMRNEGYSDKEIYTQLSEVYYDKDELASLIKFYTSDENLQKISFEIKVLKGIFIFMVTLSLIIKIENLINLDSFSDFFNFNNLMFEFSTALMILILIALFLKAITPWIYYLLNLYSIFLVLISIPILNTQLDISELDLISIGFNLLLAMIFFIFASKIKSAIYPNIKFKDLFGVQKDANGEYIFE
jgi:hypothetical protein